MYTYTHFVIQKIDVTKNVIRKQKIGKNQAKKKVGINSKTWEDFPEEIPESVDQNLPEGK